MADYEKPLVRCAAHITGDVERALEVVQDTFLKLCRQKPAHIRSHPAQWLHAVCRNGIRRCFFCLDYCRTLD